MSIDFKPITISQEYTNKYWEGPSNMFARYYTYWQRGMSLLNEARLYFYLIGGGLFTAEFIDVFGYKIPVELVIVGAALGIPMIIIAGRWDLFKLSKAREYATTTNGTITQFNSYNMAVLNIALIGAIAEKLGVDVEKIKEELKK